MNRGGKREGAGRKATWASECSRSETKPIRVPKVLAEEVLGIAHRLDAGEKIVFETDTQSIVLERKRLQEQIKSLQKQLEEKNFEKVAQSKEKNKKDIEALKKKALSILNVGSQSSTYKNAKKVLNTFVKLLLE